MFKFGKKVNKKLASLVHLLPKNAKVLDLGCGLGANSIFLMKQGFNVTCLDKDKDIILDIKKKYPKINALKDDILTFNFPAENYDLILALNVLHFFNLRDIKWIIDNILKSLKKNGLLYLQVFSTKDPVYKRFSKLAKKEKESNTFYSKKLPGFIHFFNKKEVINFFSSNRILEIKEKILEENHPPYGKHKHGIIRILVKK